MFTSYSIVQIDELFIINVFITQNINNWWVISYLWVEWLICAIIIAIF